MHLTRLLIADLSLEIRSPVSPETLGLGEGFLPFLDCGTDSAEQVLIGWMEDDPAPPPGAELIYDPGSLWRMYAEPDRTRFHAHICYPGPDGEASSAALVSTDPTWSRVQVRERRGSAPWPSLITLGAGELVVRTKIVLAGGLLVHACAIEDGGRGVAFVGHSGAGKSTLGRIWKSVTGSDPVNDDRAAIRLHGRRALLYGLPWGGTEGFARNCRVPLACVCILEQAPENALVRLTPSRALAFLLARAFLPYWDRSLMARAAENAAGLLEEIPAYLLQWKPDSSVVQLIRSAM